MKTSREIKAELKKQGFDIKGIKIKVENFYKFIWVTLPNVEIKNEIEKVICEYTGLKPYEMQISDY
ncbi:TPA: hypothetical protein U1B14_002018 [Streptococcus suis]|uniref:hypothetical protein n=1 Tax=Streptococcus suis TaxID=1307 RepID=UPI00209B8EF7|nr:hypothetical protein [Streptococcus suis]MCO8207913.1 hypothetical protein [Streptococcus suis]MCO8212328.1 hypothetical protein [Streptococcus suis]MCO8212475.1 hypothetical protein [Streptococcus suis]HEM3492592.1 hypothetical protein [Streptococcus suis]HEM3494883.1 hypothetical protein [Streptococcus suis]